jgi:hypothetical protein
LEFKNISKFILKAKILFTRKKNHHLCPWTKSIDISKDAHSQNCGKGEADNPIQLNISFLLFCSVNYTDVFNFSGVFICLQVSEAVLMNGVFIEFKRSFQIVKMSLSFLTCPDPQPRTCLRRLILLS